VEDDATKETMSSTITSIGIDSTQNVTQASKKDMPSHLLENEESQQGVISFPVKHTNKKVVPRQGQHQ